MVELFGPVHLAALGTVVLAVAAVAVVARLDPVRRRPHVLPGLLAGVLIASEAIRHLHQWHSGQWDPAYSLPLHLCDFAILLSVLALLTERRIPYELAYYWGIGGSVQALLTPVVAEPFPSPEFFSFFVAHGGVLLAVACLTIGRRMRPTPRSVPRTILITALLALAVAGTNHLLGANYMFLCRKPNAASLLDWLGPWPWYLAPMAVVGVATILALYAPYYLIDRVRKTGARA